MRTKLMKINIYCYLSVLWIVRAFASEETCQTPKCQSISEDLLAHSMNQSVSACDDFYEFVCGNWPNSHTTDKQREINNFVLLKESTERVVFGALEDNTKQFANKSHAVQFVNQFYDECVAIDQWNSRGVTPLIELIDSIVGGWPLLRNNISNHKASWSQMFTQIYSNTELSPIFSVNVQNYYNTNYIVIKPGETGIDHSTLLQPSANQKQIDSYREYIHSTAVLLGAPNDHKLAHDIEQMIELESRLAKLEDKFKSHKSFIQIGSFEAMNLATGNRVDWLEVINSILHKLGSRVDKFQITDKLAAGNFDYLEAAVDLLDDTPVDVVQNLLAWLIAMNYGGYSTRSFRHNKVIYNRYSADYYEVNNQLRCSSYAKYYWPWVLGKLFVDLRFSPEDKRKVEIIVSEIKSAFGQTMQNAVWLDETTRKYALEKLDAIEENVGYPQWIRSDQALDEYYEYLKGVKVEKGKFMEMMARVHALMKLDDFKKLARDYHTLSWQGSLLEANAFYNHYKNSITIPATILQPPFFDPNRPFAMNYGAIGAIIGHEFTHGFDNFGYHFDLHGQAKDWWTAETVGKFNEKTKCFEEQYSGQYDQVAAMNINGEQTLEENIADNGGLKTALAAFQRHEAKYGKSSILPNVQLNSDQLFFVSYAMNWCNAITKPKLIESINGDPHAPNRYRVNVVLSNSALFSDAFKCPEASKMNPTRRCAVW